MWRSRYRVVISTLGIIAWRRRPALETAGSGRSLGRALSDHPARRREVAILARLLELSCALRSAGGPSDGDDPVPDRVLDQFGCGPDPQHFHDARPVELRGPGG